ncbi:hypothetical protein [Nodosilinea sp. E11]|uniref:hypothetical protein n=1 Tax=Nodosilinea sp. E11 TaxID=3037479 RepID=UPI0029345F74|nr:hypothetical protein [Nodosilinea sp. E11]WOD38453.1 hypothetical protein RRF56_19780 [Nodosilinea sp. E11]
MKENQAFIAQSSTPTPSPLPTPSQTRQPFDPGAVMIWAALITAGLSSIATMISLIGNRRLMTRIEEERREHDLKLANIQQKHEIQIENARLRPERRLQFIGYWRKRLRNDTLTYKDIFKDKAYKTLEGFISLKVLQLIQQELDEKEALSNRLSFEEAAFNAHSIFWDDEDYASGENLAYESHYDACYANLQPEEYDAVKRGFENDRRQIEQFDLHLSKFIKEHLEEELRRLEREEWELL